MFWGLTEATTTQRSQNNYPWVKKSLLHAYITECNHFFGINHFHSVEPGSIRFQFLKPERVFFTIQTSTIPDHRSYLSLNIKPLVHASCSAKWQILLFFLTTQPPLVSVLYKAFLESNQIVNTSTHILPQRNI